MMGPFCPNCGMLYHRQRVPFGEGFAETYECLCNREVVAETEVLRLPE